MTGVDILAMEEVAVEFAFNWTWFWIMVGVGGCFGLGIGIFSVASGECEWVIIPILTTLLLLAGAGVGAAFGKMLQKPVVYAPQYKVMISDEVSMNEFLEKYEIIDIEGKIYTVREK